MDRKEIGQKIAQLRKANNMSRCRLARDAGLTPSYIPDLENGKKCPTVETLDAICFALHTTLADFFAERKATATQNKLSALSERQMKLLNDFLDSL